MHIWWLICKMKKKPPTQQFWLISSEPARNELRILERSGNRVLTSLCKTWISFFAPNSCLLIRTLKWWLSIQRSLKAIFTPNSCPLNRTLKWWMSRKYVPNAPLGSLEFPKLHVCSHPSFGPLLYFRIKMPVFVRITMIERWSKKRVTFFWIAAKNCAWTETTGRKCWQQKITCVFPRQNSTL